jgi:uncharacterized membrane protein
MSGGLYAFGTMIGYFFVFLIALLIIFILVVIPSTIIYYVLKIPATGTECEVSSSLPEAEDADQNVQSAEIDDDDFAGW